jgi:hypothetical protein
MKFRRLLLALFAGSAAIYAFYVFKSFPRAKLLGQEVGQPAFWAIMVLAITWLFVGHYLRVHKFRRFLSQVKLSRRRTNFRALFIGYLFNTLLPLRLGEPIRAYVLGRALRYSAGFIFALIVFERAVDALILALVGILLVALASPLLGTASSYLVGAALILALVGAGLLVLLGLLASRNLKLLKAWHRLTGLLNSRLRDLARFKMWSVVYGLQKVFQRRAVLRYLGVSVVMWGAYLVAAAVLSLFFFPADTPVADLLRSYAAFLGISIPSGPAYLGSFQAAADPILNQLSVGSQTYRYLVYSWALLTVPASLVGVVAVLRSRETLRRQMGDLSDQRHLLDKLSREQDISPELATFLDAYFSGNLLSHTVHQLEIQDNVQLIRYFKGGSNAITILASENNQPRVVKIVPNQYAHRLKAQYDWLKKRQHLPQIVSVSGQRQTDNFYSIDLEYHAQFQPFFDYIHSHNAKDSQQVLSNIYQYLFDHVYQLEPNRPHFTQLEDYLAYSLVGKLDQTRALNPEVARLYGYDRIVVNGVEYDNIPVILERIRTREDIWADLATYRQTEIHGDLTVDNILVSPEDNAFLIIDPVDENKISSPTIDFGRTLQSLTYGYEFLTRDDRPIKSHSNVIAYEDSQSALYRQLEQTALELADRYLEPSERRAALFHTAVHYSRMLAHRVHINPDNIAKFYGVSVVAFNQFMAQYQSSPTEDSRSKTHTASNK